MPGEIREIKKRIKSIQSTRKITKAMEMVAAAKMRKAINNVLATRTYSAMAWDMLRRLSKFYHLHPHPLLEERDEIKKIGLILITSNRGLSGNFNANVINLAADYIAFHKEKIEIEADLVLMGRKGAEAMMKFGHTVVAEFDKVDVTTRVHEVRPLAKLIIDEYLNGTYDKISIIYTDFISTIKQEPRVRQLLPISEEDAYLGHIKGEEDIELTGPKYDNGNGNGNNGNGNGKDVYGGYIFEPSAQEVLDNLLPRLIEMQIYQAVLESDASEHSSRMITMKNATDAAGDMIYDLTLSYNQARQSAITQEIAEIAAAKSALE